MDKITFECTLITDYFAAGADGIQPEFRPSSIKGALRFWWRALNGHLLLSELKRKEDEIFGGGGEAATKSRVMIRCTHPVLPTQDLFMYDRPGKRIPQKGFAAKDAHTFEITLGLAKPIMSHFGLKELQALFEITCLLGGLGKRSRRGRGSISILKYKNSGNETWIPYSCPSNLTDILVKLNVLSEWYRKENDVISFTYPGKTELYPFAQKIQIGASNPNILGKIDETSQRLLVKYGFKYEASLGHVNRRFASPIYTSVTKNENKEKLAIITILKNAADGQHLGSVSGQVADEFVQSILFSK